MFNSLGAYLRIEFDKCKVSRILPTRYKTTFWVSDYLRLFIKKITSNFSIRRIFLNGIQGNFFTLYKLNIFPSVLYKFDVIKNILVIFDNKKYFIEFLLLKNLMLNSY